MLRNESLNDEAPIPKSENNTTRELITERAVEEKEPCSMELGQSRTEETRVKGSTQAHEEPVCYTKSTFPMKALMMATKSYVLMARADDLLTRGVLRTRVNVFNDLAIHSVYHTPLHSVTICPVRMQMCSARHVNSCSAGSKLGSGSEP